MKTERGFTLLEMIVATVILAVAIVGLMSGVSGAMRNAARLTAYDRVVQLARLRMNDLLMNPMLPRDSVVNGDFDPAQTGGVNAGWRARATSFEKPPSAGPGQMALQRIELEIWWMSGRERRTFTLDAFRPYLLKPEDIVPEAP
jgi:general secretion pathway protein I